MPESQLDRLSKILLAEVGYLEKKSDSKLDDKTANAGQKNYTKYWKDLSPSLQGQPWCFAFISWGFRKAGIPTSVMPNFFSCSAGINWFKGKKQYYINSPKFGDLIFFGNPTPQHVGFVLEIRDSRVYTVEGNTTAGTTVVANGGGVAKKNYSLSYNRIIGYGRPKYEATDVEFKKVISLEENAVTQKEFNKMMDAYLAERMKADGSKWSKDVRDWVVARGYIQGDDRKNYAWTSFVTKEELAQVIYNLENAK